MEPVPPIDLTDLLKLLQSGGNLATVIGIWILWKIKAAVEVWILTLNETMAKMVKAANDLTEEIEQLELELKILEARNSGKHLPPVRHG